MKPSVIFFGNGPLADFTLEVLRPAVNLLFHAKTKENLATVKAIKQDHPDAHGVLASFGVMIKQDVLDLFEPEDILNIHTSLLPKYRGASPIESAILAGDSDFSVSVMKLVLACAAGPIYYQTTLKNLPLDKTEIYKNLAHTGATWLRDHLDNLPTPQPQDDSQATFTQKLDKSMSFLAPDKDSAESSPTKAFLNPNIPSTATTSSFSPPTLPPPHQRPPKLFPSSVPTVNLSSLTAFNPSLESPWTPVRF